MYELDDSVDKINWSWISKVSTLDPTLTYKKLLIEINDCLSPKTNLYLNFDYEAMKLLLKQAKEFDIPFASSNMLTALFFTKCQDNKLKEKLLLEYGYGKRSKTCKIVDQHLYKQICLILSNRVNLSDFELFRKMFLRELISKKAFIIELMVYPEKYLINPDYFFHRDLRSKELIESINQFYLDLVAEYLFDDYYANVTIDIKQMLKYIKLTNNQDIPINRLNLYQEFINLENKSIYEQKAFFDAHIDLDIQEAFYDDIRNLKDLSYKSLVNSCTSFTKDSPLYNHKLSEQYGCEIYYLDGEEFFAFARSDIHISKREISDEHLIVPTNIPNKDEIQRLGNCFTYIGKENIQTYKNPRDYLTMLYQGIDYHNIAHVYHSDSWSSNTYYYISDYQNELHTPKSLLEESQEYTEIVIHDLTNIKPFAILCYDKPTDWDINYSKENNMPIVIINTQKYERKFTSEKHYENQYTR